MRKQQEAEEAAYLRGRAEAMRAGMGADQAEIDFWRSQVGAGSIIYPDGGFFPSDGFGFGFGDHRVRRFGRFPVSDPFAGFLSTPITPFPRFSSGFGRPFVVRGRINQRGDGRGHRGRGHGGRGHRR